MENDIYLSKLHQELISILDEFDRVCKKYNLTYFLVGGTLLGAVRHQGFIPWDDDLDVGMPREDFDKLIYYYSNSLDDNFYIDFYSNNKNYYKPFAKIKKKNTLFVESQAENVAENNEIWVDIFPFDYAMDDKKLKKQKRYIDKIHHVAQMKAGLHVQLSPLKKMVVRTVFSCFNNRQLGKIQQKIMKKQNNKYQCSHYINFGSQYGIIKQKHLIEKYYPVSKMVFEKSEYNIPYDYDYVLKKIYGEQYMVLPPVEKRITHNPKRVIFSDGIEVKFDEKV